MYVAHSVIGLPVSPQILSPLLGWTHPHTGVFQPDFQQPAPTPLSEDGPWVKRAPLTLVKLLGIGISSETLHNQCLRGMGAHVPESPYPLTSILSHLIPGVNLQSLTAVTHLIMHSYCLSFLLCIPCLLAYQCPCTPQINQVHPSFFQICFLENPECY